MSLLWSGLTIFTGPSTAWRSRGFRTAMVLQSEREIGGLKCEP
jgi:hypothetical protein